MDLGPIGRDAEIADLRAFLSATSGAPSALGITGDPGIGKTMVSKHVLQAARRSSRVLSCQPTSAERPLAFSALDDLLRGWPRRSSRAARPGQESCGGRASGTCPEALIRLAGPHRNSGCWPGRPGRVADPLAGPPLVIAVDDAQWLDRPSAGVLEFCSRRLQCEPVTILLTFRHDIDAFPVGLDRTLPPDRLRRVRLGPLSRELIGEIVRSRLGRPCPGTSSRGCTRRAAGTPSTPWNAHAACWTTCGCRSPTSRSRSRSAEPQRPGAPPREPVDARFAARRPPRRRLLQPARAADPRGCGDGESWAAIDQAVDDGIIGRHGMRCDLPIRCCVGSLRRDGLNERREVHRRLGRRRRHRGTRLAPRPRRGQAERGDRRDARRGRAARGLPRCPGGCRGVTGTGRPPDPPPGGQHPGPDRPRGRLSLPRRRHRPQQGTDPVLPRLVSARTGRASLLLRLATIHYHQNGWPLAEQTFRLAAQRASEDQALRAHAEQEIAFARLVAGDLPGASRWARLSLRTASRTADPRLDGALTRPRRPLRVPRGNETGWVRSKGPRPSTRRRARSRSGGCRCSTRPWPPAWSSNGATSSMPRAYAWPAAIAARSTAATRRLCRSSSITSANSNAGPETGIRPRNSRWRAAARPARATSSR